MNLAPFLPLLALDVLLIAKSTSASPGLSELVARQIPTPQINVYCITHEATASYADFNSTFDDVCHDLSDGQLLHEQQVINETCYDEYCITTLLVYKCGSAGSSTSIDFDECRTMFGLPWNTPRKVCKSGGYVGSSAPGACWSALSLATPKESTERLPALPDKAWSSAARVYPRKQPHSPPTAKRQASAGVTSCVTDDWPYAVTYDEFFNNLANFCTGMVDNHITLSTGEGWWSNNNYCNDANCLNFHVNFFCVAPDGGPAYGNVTMDGCLQYFMYPWWGYSLKEGDGPCVSMQGNLIKGGSVTDRYPSPCWNFSSLVHPPLSARAALPSPDDYTTFRNDLPTSPAITDSGLVGRQSDEYGLICADDSFHGVIEGVCMFYEYCPFTNDEPFNATQHFSLFGQDLTLSIEHPGACITEEGKTGHDVCVDAFEKALDGICRTYNVQGAGSVQAGACWNFSVTLEPQSPDEWMVSPTPTKSALVGRQTAGADLTCSGAAFHDIFDVFCLLYENSTFYTDDGFSITQHYDVLGQEVTLGLEHAGTCQTYIPADQDTCVSILVNNFDRLCQKGDEGGSLSILSQNCWTFTLDVEPKQ